MEPTSKHLPIDKSSIDQTGFLKSNGNGIIGCGVSTKPKEVAAVVQEATGSVLKAIQTIRGN
jgi:heterodisulfide reductase subunit A-like polyferredoxin